MGPKEAAIAVLWLRPRVVIPMHYKTFPVIIQDADPFIKALDDIKGHEGLDVQVMTMEPGEEREL